MRPPSALGAVEWRIVIEIARDRTGSKATKRCAARLMHDDVQVETDDFNKATRISEKVEHPCPTCKVNPDDSGAAVMCINCGDFLLCGPCTMLAETGAVNGRPGGMGFNLCPGCLAEYDKKGGNPRIGLCLQKLLKNKPEGQHVNYAKLMLAQLRLNDVEEFCGIPPSRKKAKQEYLQLAGEENYALAQFALASFYDPIDEEVWSGP